MNSNTFFNRVEILLYSGLISAMSGINHLRAKIQHFSTLPVQYSPEEAIDPTPVNEQIHPRSLTLNWKSIQQAVVSLIFWVILGFAAGYLIGMIKPR